VSIDSLQLETRRLTLRPPRREDFAAFAAFMGDPETTRFLGGPQPPSAAWRTFMMLGGAWHLQGFSMFSVILKSSGQWIGRVGPWMPMGWPGTEVGWGIISSAWRNGYATEAAVAAIDGAFQTLGWDEVIHLIGPDNVGSQRVARALGSANRGRCHLPAPQEEVVVDAWGQTREMWAKRRN
jgi:RimJ/RimL family protein N-acetyltransferase